MGSLRWPECASDEAMRLLAGKEKTEEIRGEVSSEKKRRPGRGKLFGLNNRLRAGIIKTWSGRMKLEYNVTIEQSQKLVMTAELVQSIKILQFDALELDAYVDEQLLTNPVLEHAEVKEDAAEDSSVEKEDRNELPEELDDYIWERELDDISYRQGDFVRSEEQPNMEQYVSSEVTLPEHLMFQLQFVCHNARDRKIGRFLIEALDENGYLTCSRDDAAKAVGCGRQDVDRLLAVIQTFDPPGVGAENLSECLLIQMDALGMNSEPMKKMLTEHIEDLAANRIQAIAKSVGVKTAEVQEMADLVKCLNPRPGRAYAQEHEETRYIVPDVKVEKIDGEFVVSLNERSTPILKVSPYYRRVLAQSGRDSQVSEYLSERLRSAVWLIRSIEQRKTTILKVVRAIVREQTEFFEHGEKYLKPMTLRDIAEDVDIHESTVSRSVNGKYLQCAQGVFELKHFFSAGVRKQDGEGVSSVSVKTILKDLIEAEDPHAPLSDQKLVQMLKDKGIALSRRTVAKYRDEMGILSSSKRKRF